MNLQTEDPTTSDEVSGGQRIQNETTEDAGTEGLAIEESVTQAHSR